MAYTPKTPDDRDIAQFQEDGFLTLKGVLTAEQVDRILERLDPLFATRFETGIYPDEWYGRPSMSQPNATRQMVGMWRCDRTVASFTLSAEIARLNAALMGWSGGRLANDSCWIKPPSAPAVSFHRNNTAVSSINPTSIITCWIALSDCTAAAGTLEIVPRSHLWNCSDTFRFLHAPKEDYRQPLWKAAAEAGVDEPEILSVELQPGDCIFLHGNLWHGSNSNPSDHSTRRSFAVSTFSSSSRFQLPGTGTGYIYDRYRRIGSMEMDESFFPILWSQEGYRSPFADAYCEEALLAKIELASC